MRSLTCIECPKGCTITIDDKMNVTGNSCPRGKKYAINEVTAPKRVITTTVVLDSNELKRLPVMSESEIPKGKIPEVMKALNKIRVKAPIHCRDIIVSNVCDTGVNILSSRTVEE